MKVFQRIVGYCAGLCVLSFAVHAYSIGPINDYLWGTYFRNYTKPIASADTFYSQAIGAYDSAAEETPIGDDCQENMMVTKISLRKVGSGDFNRIRFTCRTMAERGIAMDPTENIILLEDPQSTSGTNYATTVPAEYVPVGIRVWHSNGNLKNVAMLYNTPSMVRKGDVGYTVAPEAVTGETAGEILNIICPRYGIMAAFYAHAEWHSNLVYRNFWKLTGQNYIVCSHIE